MNNISYIHNLYNSFLKNEDGDKLFLIRHSNSFCIDRDKLLNTLDPAYKENLIYTNFKKGIICNPYEPFIDGIRYLYNSFLKEEISIDEFLENSGVYALHKEIFSSYIEKSNSKRAEQIIFSEYLFEKKKFINSIISCYNYISTKRDVFVAINNIQFAQLGTIQVLKSILDNISELHFKILIIYNENHSAINYISEDFNYVLQKSDDTNFLYEWEDQSGKFKKTSEKIVANDFDNYIMKIKNLFNMLAIEDAQYYINKIHREIVEDKMNVSNDSKFDLYFYSSLCSILTKDINLALVTSERLMNFYDRKKDLKHEYLYNYVCGLIQMSREQSDLTINFANNCLKIAKKLEDDELIFESEVLYQEAQFGGWRDVFVVDFSELKIDDSMIEKLKKHKYYNTLAYYLIYGHDNDYESIERMVSGINSDTYNEAISIGKRLGNTCFLLSAYTKYIVMFTENGFHKHLQSLYDKKLEILTNEHNERRRAHLLMGMGYNNMINEEYNKASGNFIAALKILYKEKNAEEIAETLYNMAENCICVEDFQSSLLFMNAIFKILDNIGIETIQICNTSKLYSLLAISYYGIGNNYRCFKVLENTRHIVNQFIINPNKMVSDYRRWNEDVFLYYMIQAMLDKENGDFESAGINFKEALGYFDSCYATIFYCDYMFFKEYYDYFIKINDEKSAFKILDYGLNYYKKNGYTHKFKKLLLVSESQKNNKNYISFDLSENDIDVEKLVELSYSLGKEKQLYESKKDISFLSTWQEKLNRDDLSTTDFISTSIMTLQKNFNLDEVILININKDNDSIIYNNTHLSDDDIIIIKDYIKDNKKAYIINSNDKSFVEYKLFNDLFKNNKILVMVAIPLIEDDTIVGIFAGFIKIHKNFRHSRNKIDEGNIMIIKTAIIQLENAIERIKNKQDIIEMNKRLNDLAITDMLTSLYNRQGLSKMLDMNKNSNENVAILYADLDNFKYYNDTFGHDVGDIILSSFANVINNISKEKGFAVRYGGDEFLIVLRNVTRDYTIKCAKQIYSDIKDGFVDVVRNYLKKDISIPTEKLVCCSIGISFSEDSSLDNINTALKEADNALYYMKRNTKGHYVLWEDIK